MLAYWTEFAPPPHISLARLASAHGAGQPGVPRAPSGPKVEPAEPFAIQSMLGQAEVRKYDAPRMGLKAG